MNDTATTKEQEEPEFIRKKLLHALKIYPALSASGIQVAIGPYISAKKWRPVLKELLDEGEVCQDEISLMAPDDRTRSYTRFYLPENAGAIEVEIPAEDV